MTDTASQKSANPESPCMVCGNAQLMDFPRGTTTRTEVFCMNIHKLMDEGLPISCSGFAPRSQAE